LLFNNIAGLRQELSAFFLETTVKKLFLILFLIILPISAQAALLSNLDEPLKGLSDNTIYDIVIHNDKVWLATGRGLAFVAIGDTAWFTYDSRTGLVSDEVSAIYSDHINGRLWAATNHSVEIGGDTYAYADGLSFTDNDGQVWDTLMVPGSFGYQYTVFDIAGFDSLIFCASWAGGLFGSFDKGLNWRHIFYSDYDSALADSGYGYASYTNTYYSAVLDMSRQDSIILWAGSANGLMRYIYGPPYAKQSSNNIIDLASGAGYLFLAGDSGLTRLHFENTKEKFHSSFQADGLPGRAISGVFFFGDRLFVGTLDTIRGRGTGLAISSDTGLTFTSGFSGLDDLMGPDRYPMDFAAVGSSIFMAGLKGGLYRSNDTGDTWQKIQFDTINPPVFRTTYSIASDSMRLWAGTDSALILLFIDSAGGIDSMRHFPMYDTDSTGALCRRVRAQQFRDPTTGNLDSTAVWTINYPIDTNIGSYGVQRYSVAEDEWTYYPSDTTPYYDIAFIDAAIYIVGENSFAYSPDAEEFAVEPGYAIQDSLYSDINFSELPLTSIEVINDTIYIGSTRGFAVSPSKSNRWHILRANTDPTRHDKVERYAYPTISGSWVPVLAIQNLPDGSGLIWANCRVGADDSGQVSVSASPLDGSDWDIKHLGSWCWNFAFHDSSVFAASSDGLLFSPDLGESWDTVSISGTLVNYQPQQPYTMGRGTPIYAVEVIGDTLWIGSGDGAAKIGLDVFGESGWDIYRALDTSQIVYAYPVPYSAYPISDGNQITFHYPMRQSGMVTIEVYDFNMNLVKRVIDGEWRVGGPGVIYSSDRWNGHNGKGDIVAVGIYYFKIEQSNGDVFWGKLAVIP
jgi:hypothetical protein